ncbi:MAG: hypothetical protein P1V20_24320 [Verrucomicrobiales bacterium]|nr:hypothetical protein [Verrucomicrobiales bacterium]
MDQNNGNEIGNPGKSGSTAAYGCGLGCLALLLIGGIVIFLGYQAIQSKVNSFADKASPNPIEFDYPEVQVHEAEAVFNRFDTFQKSLANDQVPDKPLILTKDEINILINHHKNFAPLAGKVQVDIANNHLLVEGSLKPSDLPVEIPLLSKAFGEKYINGKITTDFAVSDGIFGVNLLEFELAGTRIPEELLPKISDEFMRELRRDKEIMALIDKMDVVKIENGRVYAIPKKAP